MQPEQNNNIPPQVPQPDVIPTEMYTPESTAVTAEAPAVASTNQPAAAVTTGQPIQPAQVASSVDPNNVSDQPDIQSLSNVGTIDESIQPIQTDSENEPVYWSANEYIHQEKNGLWFVIFGIVIISLIAVDILVIKSAFYSFSILIVVMAIAVIMYSRRPPRTIDYTLSGDQGLYVGERLYHFSEFKAFGLIKDQGEHSIMMIPVKRFSPGLTVYFPEESGEEIVDIFGARLPMQDLKLDVIDVIVRKLRL